MKNFKQELEKIKEEGRLLMECIAGSHLYNLSTPSSDEDIRGVFAPTFEELLSGDYPDEISDDDQDIKFYSLPKFLKLAADCNPNIIELLYVPEEKILFCHPAWQKLLSFRDLFLSQKARHTFSGYAFAQIKKCKGAGKKANSIPNMVSEEGIHFLRYALQSKTDFFRTSFPEFSSEKEIERVFGKNFLAFLKKKTEEEWKKEDDIKNAIDGVKKMLPPKPEKFFFWMSDTKEGFHFRPTPFLEDPSLFDVAQVEGVSNLYRAYSNGTGFLSEDGLQVICHSISKERELLDFSGILLLNIEEYSRKRREWDSFWEWMANRNEVRYSESWDSEKTCDMKNLMHCMRLLICAESIAKFKLPKVEFSGEEKDFLMRIRNGKEEASSILNEAEKKMNLLEKEFQSSDLPYSANLKEIKEKVREEIYPLIYEKLSN